MRRWRRAARLRRWRQAEPCAELRGAGRPDPQASTRRASLCQGTASVWYGLGRTRLLWAEVVARDTPRSAVLARQRAPGRPHCEGLRGFCACPLRTYAPAHTARCMRSGLWEGVAPLDGRAGCALAQRGWELRLALRVALQAIVPPLRTPEATARALGHLQRWRTESWILSTALCTTQQRRVFAGFSSSPTRAVCNRTAMHGMSKT